MNLEDYADHLIDVYLEGLTSISNDAGWEGDSMMARLIQFHGEIPPATRNDKSNETMIRAIEKLRKKHAHYDALRREIWKMLGNDEENPKILALLAERYYQGLNPKTGKKFNYVYKLSSIGYAPIPTGNPIKDGQAWENRRRNFNRRAASARILLLERMEKHAVAA